MHESVLFWGLLKAQAAFPQYGKLACVPTDKIAWRRHRAPIEEEPEINHKALLLLLYPVAARAANLHSGTPGPIDRCSAAHPAPPPPRPRAESKIFASERPEGVPGGGGGGARGSRARAEAQLRKHALTVGRLIPPNVTCAKRPPESLLWRRPLIFQNTFHPSVNSNKFEIKFSFVGFLQISNLGLVSCGVGRPWRDRGGAAVPSLIFCCQPLRLPPARGWGVGMSKVQVSAIEFKSFLEMVGLLGCQFTKPGFKDLANILQYHIFWFYASSSRPSNSTFKISYIYFSTMYKYKRHSRVLSTLIIWAIPKNIKFKDKCLFNYFGWTGQSILDLGSRDFALGLVFFIWTCLSKILPILWSFL